MEQENQITLTDPLVAYEDLSSLYHHLNEFQNKYSPDVSEVLVQSASPVRFHSWLPRLSTHIADLLKNSKNILDTKPYFVKEHRMVQSARHGYLRQLPRDLVNHLLHFLTGSEIKCLGDTSVQFAEPAHLHKRYPWELPKKHVDRQVIYLQRHGKYMKNLDMRHLLWNEMVVSDKKLILNSVPHLQHLKLNDSVARLNEILRFLGPRNDLLELSINISRNEHVVFLRDLIVDLCQVASESLKISASDVPRILIRCPNVADRLLSIQTDWLNTPFHLKIDECVEVSFTRLVELTLSFLDVDLSASARKNKCLFPALHTLHLKHKSGEEQFGFHSSFCVVPGDDEDDDGPVDENIIAFHFPKIKDVTISFSPVHKWEQYKTDRMGQRVLVVPPLHLQPDAKSDFLFATHFLPSFISQCGQTLQTLKLHNVHMPIVFVNSDNGNEPEEEEEESKSSSHVNEITRWCEQVCNLRNSRTCPSFNQIIYVPLSSQSAVLQNVHVQFSFPSPYMWFVERQFPMNVSIEFPLDSGIFVYDSIFNFPWFNLQDVDEQNEEMNVENQEYRPVKFGIACSKKSAEWISFSLKHHHVSQGLQLVKSIMLSENSATSKFITNPPYMSDYIRNWWFSDADSFSLRMQNLIHLNFAFRNDGTFFSHKDRFFHLRNMPHLETIELHAVRERYSSGYLGKPTLTLNGSLPKLRRIKTTRFHIRWMDSLHKIAPHLEMLNVENGVCFEWRSAQGQYRSCLRIAHLRSLTHVRLVNALIPTGYVNGKMKHLVTYEEDSESESEEENKEIKEDGPTQNLDSESKVEDEDNEDEDNSHLLQISDCSMLIKVDLRQPLGNSYKLAHLHVESNPMLQVFHVCHTQLAELLLSNCSNIRLFLFHRNTWSGENEKQIDTRLDTLNQFILDTKDTVQLPRLFYVAARSTPWTLVGEQQQQQQEQRNYGGSIKRGTARFESTKTNKNNNNNNTEMKHKITLNEWKSVFLNLPVPKFAKWSADSNNNNKGHSSSSRTFIIGHRHRVHWSLLPLLCDLGEKERSGDSAHCCFRIGDVFDDRNFDQPAAVVGENTFLYTKMKSRRYEYDPDGYTHYLDDNEDWE